MRCALLLLCAVLAWAEAGPADLGGPSPGFAGASWLRGGAPPGGSMAVVVFWSAADGLDVDLVAGIDGAMVVTLADIDDEAVKDQAAFPGRFAVGVATPELTTRWLGAPDAPLPAVVLVGADGLLLWRGGGHGIARAIARERAGGFDRAMLADVSALRARLRVALDDEAGLDRALALTGDILTREPADEEAVRLRLDLCRHLDRREAFRETLETLPLDRVPPELANELAWARVTDEDLAWRHPDLALRLVEHALRLSPSDGAIEDTHARVLALLGLIDDAVAAQVRAVSLLPDDVAALEALDYYRDLQALREQRLKAAVKPPASP